MNLNKSLIVLLASMLMSLSLQAEDIEVGSIAVIDVEAAIYGTEASKPLKNFKLARNGKK